MMAVQKVSSVKQLVAVLRFLTLSIIAVLMLQTSVYAATSRLSPGQSLSGGGVMTADNGMYRLAMQTDGNLVLYTQANKVLWASRTEGNAGARLEMQMDGNLVIYSTANRALWSSGTPGNGGAFLTVQTDGNVVIYSGDGSRALWNTNTRIVPDNLQSGQSLTAGQELRPASGQPRLVMQGDGNLVLYGKNNKVLWFSHTEGNAGARLEMQTDGNLVIYSTANRALWSSGTAGNGGAFLIVQGDGNVVLYSGNRTRALWNTNTRVFADSVVPGQALNAGQEIRSDNGQNRLVMQGDGNLVLYGAGGNARWASNTFSAGSRVVMQGDGNLVIYDTGGRAKWASGTNGYGNEGARLVLQDDGNLVIYSPTGKALWDTRTRIVPDTLPSGQTLTPGQEIRSANGQHRLVMQGDGNLVVYGPNGARWSSNTFSSGSWAVMQTDGNLVVYDSGGRAKWASGTNGNNGARLAMQDDGNLVIYAVNGVARWAIGAYGVAISNGASVTIPASTYAIYNGKNYAGRVINTPTPGIAAGIAAGFRYLGLQYSWGGGNANGPTLGIHDYGIADRYGDYARVGFDCSGLTTYVAARYPAALPRLSYDQRFSAPRQIPWDQAQPGDLVGYDGHITIYLGVIDGVRMQLESPQSGDYVKISAVRGGADPVVHRWW